MPVMDNIIDMERPQWHEKGTTDSTNALAWMGKEIVA